MLLRTVYYHIPSFKTLFHLKHSDRDSIIYFVISFISAIFVICSSLLSCIHSPFFICQNLLLLSYYKRVHNMNQHYQYNPKRQIQFTISGIQFYFIYLTIIISTLGIIYVFITVVFCKFFTKAFCI